MLLDEVAAATPAPGGGTSIAWTCALAAALVEMTSAFAVKRSDRPEHREQLAEIDQRAHALRRRAHDLAEQELHAYEPVLTALRLPRDDPSRSEQIELARLRATESPLALARVAAEVAELALEASRIGPVQLRGDAQTGALLAEGACRAAARLVEINLEGRIGDERLVEIGEITRRAAATREQIET